MNEKNSVDIFFGEIRKSAEAAARKKISAEHRALKKENTRLKKIEKNIKEEVDKRFEKVKQNLSAREKKVTNLENRERSIRAREERVRDAENRIRGEIKAIDKLKKMPMKTWIEQNRTYSNWQEGARTRAVAALRNGVK